MEESLGCVCISTGPAESSNHATTNFIALEPIFLFFQLSSTKLARTDSSIKQCTSVLFWEDLVKSMGMGSLISNRMSDDGNTTSSGATEIPVTDLSPATIWIPDSEVSECQTCLKSFSFLIRKHHCRLCGRVVCGDCSKFRMVLEKSKTPVRVCRSCYYGHVNDCLYDC